MAKVTITIEDHLSSGAVRGNIQYSRGFNREHATIAEKVATALIHSFQNYTIPNLKEHGLKPDKPVLQ